MMYRHIDYATNIENDDDKDILTRPSFDVNMRLFGSSEQYRKIILDICSYLRWCVFTEKEGYPRIAGYSGANAGIPFNIIVVRSGDRLITMINPQLIAHSDETVSVYTNCGSLSLKEMIWVDRRCWIVVEYYNEAGDCIVDQFDGALGGYTIQHELEHINGTLIKEA